MKYIIFSAKKCKPSWFFYLLGSVIILLIFVFSNPLFHKAEEVWGTPLSGKSIAIDPGHGGPDGGAVGIGGIQEKDVTLKISHYVKGFLEGSGANVILTRETDRDLANSNTKGLSRRKAEDLRKRLNLIHERNVDVFVSIHLNSIPSPRWYGAQTFFNPANDRNKVLATLIQKEVVKNLENTSREAKQKNNIYLLRESKVPTALVEVGFLSNPREASLLKSDSYQKKIAAAIYYGILHYYEKGSKEVKELS